MDVYIPGIRLVSPNKVYRNASMFARMKTAKTAAKQRSDVGLFLSVYRRPKLPVRVTVTRYAARSLDSHDNLTMSAKHIVDAIAQWLGIDDADKRVEWKFQELPGRFAVGILVEQKLTTMPELEQCKLRLVNAIKAARYWRSRAKGMR